MRESRNKKGNKGRFTGGGVLLFAKGKGDRKSQGEGPFDI